MHRKTQRGYGAHRNPWHRGAVRLAREPSEGVELWASNSGFPPARYWLAWVDGTRARLVPHRDGFTEPLDSARAQRVLTMAVKKRQQSGGGAVHSAANQADAMSVIYKAIHEHLTATEYDDGTKRTPGSMTLFMGEGGYLKACINDKDTGEIAFVTADGLEALFDLLQAQLENGTCDWRLPRANKRRP